MIPWHIGKSKRKCARNHGQTSESFHLFFLQNCIKSPQLYQKLSPTSTDLGPIYTITGMIQPVMQGPYKPSITNILFLFIRLRFDSAIEYETNTAEYVILVGQKLCLHLQ